MYDNDIKLLQQFIDDAGSQKKASELLGISEPSLSNYKKGKVTIGPAMRERLRELGYGSDVDKAEEIRAVRNTARQMLLKEEVEIYSLQTEIEQKVKKLEDMKVAYKIYKDVFDRLDNLAEDSLRRTSAEPNEQSIPLMQESEKSQPLKKR